MEANERLQIEHACRQLVMRYCHLIDHGEAGRVAELFTDDGTWKGPGMLMSGRAELERGFQLRQDNAGRMSRHVCQNFLCDVIDAGHAEAVTYLTLYRSDGEPGRKTSPLTGPALVGEYRDSFAHTAEGWRIASRETHVSFVADAG